MSLRALKAEIKKIRYSEPFYIMLILTCVLFLLYLFSLDGLKLMVSGDIDTINGHIGFIVREYSNPLSPTFLEAMRSAFSFSFFIMLILLYFSLMYMDSEFSVRTFTNIFTRGKDRKSLYSTKLFVIAVIAVVIFNTFCLSAFFYETINLKITTDVVMLFFKYTALFNIIMLSFLFLGTTIYLTSKNYLIPSISLLLINVFVASSYMMNFNNIEHTSDGLKLLYYISHIYYLQNISSLRLNEDMVSGIVVVHGGFIIFSIIISLFYIQKKDF